MDLGNFSHIFGKLVPPLGSPVTRYGRVLQPVAPPTHTGIVRRVGHFSLATSPLVPVI